jgi:hopanoid biosynthesis associated RND transporter like protein HpnN
LSLTTQTGRVLRGLVRISCARPRITVLLAVLLAGLSVAYAIRHLGFKTDQSDLLPRSTFIQRYAEYEREFGDLDDLVIVVEARSLPEAQAYAARLVHELRVRAVPLTRLTYRIDLKQLEGRALLYLSKERLTEIRERIFDYQDFMEALAARPTLDQLVDGIATQIANAFVTGFLDLGLGAQKTTLDLRFIDDLVGQIASRLDRPTPYRSPFGALFSVGGIDESSAGYFLSDDRRLLFILTRPRSEEGSFTGNQEAIAGIRRVVRELGRDFPTVRVGVTGKPALANDEMTAAFRDSERATVLAFALTLLLLMLAFLRVGKPLVMVAVLALSLCWSIGVATLVVGHLSLFSVMFISIVIGIGIDYGIYFLFRYEEELFLGRNLREALETTARRSGSGMLIGAITAAGTFYVLVATEFRGLQELGFIAGTAIFLAWVAMMTVFPAALMLIDRRHADRAGRRMPRAMALEQVRVPLFEHVAGHARTVLTLAVVLSLLAVWGATRVKFDYNLLNLQSKRTESVVWERRILETAGRSGFAALASARSLEELREKHNAFAKLPSVSEVDSALLLIPDDQEVKRKIIADIAPIVTPVRVGRPLPVDIGRLTQALETLHRRLGIAANEAPPGEAKIKLAATVESIQRLILKLRQSEPSQTAPPLSLLQYQVYRDFLGNFQRLQDNLNPRDVGLADLPEELRQKFVGANGTFLIRVNPAVDIWELEGARRFVEELRRVDPDVTGTPVITYETILLMERSYLQATIYAIVLVALMSFVLIRHVRETLLSLVPLGLGLLWTVGLMPLLGLKFTMGNIFGLPLILGAAAEFGLNVVLRFMEDREHGGPLIARSTIMAVLVNGLTTIVGFGSLMIADHRGIFGLGLLLTIGMVTSLIAALVVLPVLLRLTHPAPSTPAPVPRVESAEPATSHPS